MLVHQSGIDRARTYDGISYQTKKRINTTDLNSFLTKSQEYNFSDKLFNTLSAREINENNFTNYPIRQLVIGELEKYYDWLETVQFELIK